jgi:glycine oxidase
MERWWGFRPCTPDQGPLLGESDTPGLWLATGHHRNGVLLAAISARLVATAICNPSSLNGSELELIQAFSCSRF